MEWVARHDISFVLPSIRANYDARRNTLRGADLQRVGTLSNLTVVVISLRCALLTLRVLVADFPSTSRRDGPTAELRHCSRTDLLTYM